VVRGDNGYGAAGLRCATCHHTSNFDAAHVPGHPEWHLAPATMAWQGRSLGEIALKSRIAPATAIATWPRWSIIWPRIRSSAGHGRRALDAIPRRVVSRSSVS